ncbi:MAG TPA: ABC transporter substrate-binding protein [Acidimicrobiales bacterium]|nr:ABC transporter substrate-binding protein [Acidimicrobiales bacterium]
MTRQNPLWRLLALLFALTLIAAACGDDDDDSADAGDDTTDTTAADEGDEPAGEDDGVLTIGTLLPETGSLAFLGPPEFAGVDLAVQEINESGLMGDVEVVHGDSGDTSTDIANQTVDRLLSENADVIIGAASSGVTLTVIDKIVGAGVVQISPANTAKSLSDYDDNDLYFRTAPSDILQGQVLGEIIIEDGNSTVGILALQDPYGEGLAEDLTTAITDAGGEVVETKIYDPNAQNFDAEVQAIVDADPDAIAVIGFDESARVITTMIEKGIGPADKKVYGTDGNMGNALGEQLADSPGALNGMKGTTPLVELSQDFKDRLLAVDDSLVDFNYAAESYDAVMLAALASLAADSTSGEAIGAELINVSGEGTQCSTFKECAELLADGEDIDYEGVSGPIDFDEKGDPGQASFGILQFNESNTLDTLEYRVAGA